MEDAEPDFTNIGAGGANIKRETIFIDTLDYLFYSAGRGIKVEKFDELRHRDTLAKPDARNPAGEVYPNIAMPSDHVPMGGLFQIPGRESLPQPPQVLASETSDEV